MLTKETVLEALTKGTKQSEAIDGRDLNRLASFCTPEEMGLLGMVPNNPETFISKEFTKENVLKQLQVDLDFAFEKALDKRGLSAGAMRGVVKMWLWILEDELQHDDNYPMYGLPLLKAVALKYGFENPIGEDTGSEDKYNEESY